MRSRRIALGGVRGGAGAAGGHEQPGVLAEVGHGADHGRRRWRARRPRRSGADGRGGCGRRRSPSRAGRRGPRRGARCARPGGRPGWWAAGPTRRPRSACPALRPWPASMLSTRSREARPTQASASSWAASGVPARAVIGMITVSGVWAASMLPTRASGVVSRPRSSMTSEAVSRSLASTTYDAARDLDSMSLRLSRPGSPPPPEVTKPGRAGGVDLGLQAAPPEGGRGGHEHHRRHRDPVVAQDAQVVGELHGTPLLSRMY